MKLSPAAVAQLRELLNQPHPKLIKVGVVAKGCSGQAYDLQYVEKPGMFDEQVEQDGVKVLIDSKALLTIIGSEMDYVEDKLNQRFVFHNPNISKLLSGVIFSAGANLYCRGAMWMWRIIHNRLKTYSLSLGV